MHIRLPRILLPMLLLLGCTTTVLADGMMIPAHPTVPAFSVAYHRVKVTIDRQIATTDIDQAFHNQASQPVEGTYVFPIADGISLSKFTMYANNEELSPRILEKAEARSIYNGIVSKRQDPALLEWVGTRMIKASVFPIAPGEDKRIRIAYQEALKAQNGVIKYVYPLKTEKLSAKPLKDCSVEIAINSAQPIRSIYSPTHNVTITRDNEHTAHVSYAEKNVLPDQDLILYYTVSEQELGMNLLTYRDPDRGDGYFLLMAAPKVALQKEDVQPKDVVFVIDTSGSMSGKKIDQVKEALLFCVRNLDARDHINIVAFNHALHPWREGMQQASAANTKEAEAFVKGLNADGNTDINQALLSALKLLADLGNEEVGHPRDIIFLTDGLPTVGEQNTEKIVANIVKGNPRHAHVFAFGVGADYNAHFLDKLANANNGTVENVMPEESIEGKISGFYAQIAAPVLTNLTLDWGKAVVYDVFPRTLTDLYKGSQLLITGRYKVDKDAVTTPVRLSGTAGGKNQVTEVTATFPLSAYGDEYIPRLWATRKIGYLEDEMRLQGTSEALMTELVRLSKMYGILSQYTSFLVDIDAATLNAPGGARQHAFSKGDRDLALDGKKRLEEARNAQVGWYANAQSTNSRAATNATQSAPTSGSYIRNQEGRLVQLSQMRNISQRSFIQNGAQWIDVNYNDKLRAVKVKAFSPAYFQLANANTRMAQYLSMGKDVTIALKDVAVQAGPDGQEAEFSPAELKRLKEQMDDELGVASAMGGGPIPLAMVSPLQQPTLLWACAVPLVMMLAIPLGWRRRLRVRVRKG